MISGGAPLRNGDALVHLRRCRAVARFSTTKSSRFISRGTTVRAQWPPAQRRGNVGGPSRGRSAACGRACAESNVKGAAAFVGASTAGGRAFKEPGTENIFLFSVPRRTLPVGRAPCSWMLAITRAASSGRARPAAPLTRGSVRVRTASTKDCSSARKGSTVER